MKNVKHAIITDMDTIDEGVFQIQTHPTPCLDTRCTATVPMTQYIIVPSSARVDIVAVNDAFRLHSTPDSSITTMFDK